MNNSSGNSPRPLPIRPRPTAGESTVSYIRRLARANHLRPQYLRRCLQDADHDGIRLDWLAAMAGRPVTSLERAFIDTEHRQPQHPPTRSRHRVDKVTLLKTLRRDAYERGLSIRSISDRHGVGQRTVLQALESPIPRPRKRPTQRKSRLDPFKNTIDEILRQDLHEPHRSRRNVKCIMDELTSRHGMTDVSYGVVRSYVAHQRNLLRLPAPSDVAPATSPTHTAHGRPAPSSPTHYAVEQQNLPRLRKLLNSGHHIEDDTGNGWTLLRRAIHVEHDHHVQTDTPLHADITAFLLARGADPRHQRNSLSVIEEARDQGHWLATEIMQAWINRGQHDDHTPPAPPEHA